MSNNLAIIKEKLSSPGALAQFKLALPEHITPEKFQRVAMTAILNDSDLMSCDTNSIFSSLMKCAQDGLMPDKREAVILKYGSTATYLPMVYGLIKRMRNSGEVKAVNAYLVFEKDKFEYEIVDGVQHFNHKPYLGDDRGNMVLAYCVVKLADAEPHIEVMMRSEIEKARNAGKAANGPAWKNWYEEMAKKTVIHRAAKRVPTSAEVDSLLRNDMKVMLNGDSEEKPKTQSLIDSINDAIEVEATTVITEDGEVIEPKSDFPGDSKAS